MPYTSHGHHIEGTTWDYPQPTSRARCGGPGLCPVCSREASLLVPDEKDEALVSNENHEPIVPMNENTNYPVRARELVAKHIDGQFEMLGIPLPAYEVYVVWFCKTLQNWKAICGTTMPDRALYEVTYNGDKGETYLDAYLKTDNVVIKD